MRVPLNILDLAPASAGRTRKQALDDSLALAQLAEAEGYHRFWMAEHHGSRTFMSSATALLLGRAAEHTERIRLGSGGVMLPNHPPLMVAEYYGTLATMHGDRFDLGLGRAPGTSPQIAAELHRGGAGLQDFANNVAKLATFLGPAEDNPSSVRAIPGEDTRVPLWMLGSSTGGAQVAAVLGLPFCFASHFAPDQLTEALTVYRANFTTDSGFAQVDRPTVMAGVNMMVAPTRDEAEYLYTTNQALRDQIRSGRTEPLVEPCPDRYQPPQDRGLNPMAMLGAPDEVVEQLDEFVAAHGLDEVIVTCYAHDPELRRRSHALLARAWAAA